MNKNRNTETGFDGREHKPTRRVMNVNELAEYLGLCKNTAYSLLHTEGFPAVKFGRRYVITEDSLIDWLNKRAGSSVDIWKRS